MDMTIFEIATNHYLPEKRRRKKTDTVDGYESSLKLHVFNRWGDMTIAQITPDSLQEWVDELALTAGPCGAWKAFKSLRQVINWAIKKWCLFVANPTLSIEKPYKKPYKPDVLTPRRIKRLIRGMVGCECEASIIISAALGTRPSETYAVKWERINWRTGHVPIDCALINASDGTRLWTTKTAKGVRDCYLPPWALDRLHQIWIAKGRPRGLVIGELKPRQVFYRIKKWAKANRLPWVGMKNLRHTWGTIALQSGVPIETVAAMMGHSNVQTTYRYYFALSAAASRRAHRRWARSVLGKTKNDMYQGIVLDFPNKAKAA